MAKSKVFKTPKTITATPSGVQIAYFSDEPRRAYFVRKGEPGVEDLTWTPGEEPSDGWYEVPSVTTVLDVLGKDALSWWGMRIGFKAIAALWDKGLMSFTQDGRLAVSVDAVWQYADFADGGNVEELIKQNKLDVNQVKDDAGDRGTSAHAALEAWAVTGELPDPEQYPPEEFDYLVALRKFCDDMGEKDVDWECQGVEIAVGSVEHGFAGRYDLRMKMLRERSLVERTLTVDGKGLLKKGPKRIVLPAGKKLLLDAKTTKRIYPTHLAQLEAYEGGGIECGYEPTDMRAVIHLSATGEYQFFPAKAGYQDFLDLIPAYHAVARAKKALQS